MEKRRPPKGWTPAAFDTATIEAVGLRGHLYLAHWLDLSEGPELGEVHRALHDDRTQHEMIGQGFVRYDHGQVTFHDPEDHSGQLPTPSDGGIGPVADGTG